MITNTKLIEAIVHAIKVALMVSETTNIMWLLIGNTAFTADDQPMLIAQHINDEADLRNKIEQVKESAMNGACEYLSILPEQRDETKITLTQVWEIAVEQVVTEVMNWKKNEITK